MAWVLLAFPEAPVEFRLGLAEVMADEQRHTRMHADHAASLGIRFGELPVNCYIWKKSQEFQSVLDYLAGIPLTFEVAQPPANHCDASVDEVVGGTINDNIGSVPV
jgi:uncharacterized ferritin-like protein (DUF455 family)